MKKYLRTCCRCGKQEETFSRTPHCRLCAEAIALENAIADHETEITGWGYTILSGPVKDKNGHLRYELITPCGHQWSVKYGNISKLVSNAKDKGLPMPCGTCGPKHRLTNALSAYIEKYGRDYDIKKWDDYRLLVRKLSDITYRQFKEEINPQNHRRGKKTWHLDHIFPIIECFKQGWPAEKAASRENLQMLLWSDNLMKSGKC